MKINLKVLVVDDELEFRELLVIILEKQGYVVDSVESGEQAINLLSKKSYDVVITDMMMDGMDGLDVLEFVQKEKPHIETIIITAYGSVENAVEAMKHGAFSYFIKSNSPQELIFDIEKIVKIKSLHNENEILKTEINKIEYIMTSKSQAFQKVLKYARKVAETDSNVLILGESGVGKEALARYIHHCSNRNNEVFMPINCYSFSESLLESELYGHEKGSFTGSQGMRKGRFESADKGTLFLDEIGDIPLSTQIKILRNIENKQIERIGSNLTIDLDFRLISATNKDLRSSIADKSFREDFYYRVSTVIIEIPPLKERKEDLPTFIEYFFKKAQDSLKKRVESIDDDVMNTLLNYDYPGNVRELKNIIERLVVLSESGSISSKDMSHYNIFNGFSGQENKMSLKDIRSAAERDHITKVIHETDYNIDETAEILKISSRQLYNKLKEYEIDIK